MVTKLIDYHQAFAFFPHPSLLAKLGASLHASKNAEAAHRFITLFAKRPFLKNSTVTEAIFAQIKSDLPLATPEQAESPAGQPDKAAAQANVKK